MGFFRGFSYAAHGLWFCIRHERNFRIHMTVAVYVLVFASYFSLTRSEWAALLGIIALVLAAEALNTAIEQAVNLATHQHRHRARVAKDVAAGAVFICAMLAVAIGFVLFARWDVWQFILQDFGENWWKGLVFILSVPAALVFIVGGGKHHKKPIPPAE